MNRERSENLRLIAELNSEVIRLRQENKTKQFEFQTKENVFFEEISQLIKDRKILENKLCNLQLTSQQPSTEFPNSQFLQNITFKLNQKDARIRELETLHHESQMKIDLLTFEVENLRARTLVLNLSTTDSEQLIFEEAYRHLEKEVEKYKEKIVFKDEEIRKTKEKLLAVLEEKECLGN